MIHTNPAVPSRPSTPASSQASQSGSSASILSAVEVNNSDSASSSPRISLQSLSMSSPRLATSPTFLNFLQPLDINSIGSSSVATNDFHEFGHLDTDDDGYASGQDSSHFSDDSCDHEFFENERPFRHKWDSSEQPWPNNSNTKVQRHIFNPELLKKDTGYDADTESSPRSPVLAQNTFFE